MRMLCSSPCCGGGRSQTWPCSDWPLLCLVHWTEAGQGDRVSITTRLHRERGRLDLKLDGEWGREKEDVWDVYQLLYLKAKKISKSISSRHYYLFKIWRFFYSLQTRRISLVSNSDFFYKTKKLSGKGEEYRVMEKGQILFQIKVFSIRENSGYYLKLQKNLKMLP